MGPAPHADLTHSLWLHTALLSHRRRLMEPRGAALYVVPAYGSLSEATGSCEGARAAHSWHYRPPSMTTRALAAHLASLRATLCVHSVCTVCGTGEGTSHHERMSAVAAALRASAAFARAPTRHAVYAGGTADDQRPLGELGDLFSYLLVLITYLPTYYLSYIETPPRASTR